MLKIIFKSLFLHRRENIVIIISFLIFITILIFSNQLISISSNTFSKKQEIKIEDDIQKELNTASKQREEIIASKTLNTYIKNKDLLGLLTISQEEVKNRGIDSIVITDEDGFVLSRSHLPSQRGDNFFETTAHGRRVSQGQTITAITRGGRSPLIFTSSSPLKEDGKTIGGISTGYTINNSYINRFKEKYLQIDTQIAFYTKREGIVGDSFKDKEKTQLINTYFSLGSELVAENLTQLSKEVKIGEKYYSIRHIIFPGIEQSPGGAFIFIPINHNFYALLFATTLILIFFIIYFLTIFLLKFLHHHKHREPILLLLGLIIFIVVYFISIIKLNNSAIEIKKTPYLIYNSTMKFDPESDIINKSSEKTIAIKVYTGGEAINVVRVVLNYNPKIIKVLDILTTNSLCDPNDFLNRDIDNKKGQVKIVCHTSNINPGFYEPVGTVAELLILPIEEGAASFEFGEETQVLAGDGFETNVLRKTTGAFYHIVNQELSIGKQKTIPVFSPNHSNSNRWYQNKNIQLAWPLVKGSVYSYAFDKNTNFTPQSKIVITTNNYLDVPVYEDGIYYFHLKAKDATGRTSLTSHFKIMIDNTPPFPPKIEASSTIAKKGDVVRLNFTSEDRLSGTQSGFYVSINNSIFLPIKPPFYMPLLKKGDYTITARVFDKANNFNDNSIVIQVKN